MGTYLINEAYERIKKLDAEREKRSIETKKKHEVIGGGEMVDRYDHFHPSGLSGLETGVSISRADSGRFVKFDDYQTLATLARSLANYYCSNVCDCDKCKLGKAILKELEGEAPCQTS